MRPNHTFKHLIDEGFRPFRKDAVVWAKQMAEPFEVLTAEGPSRSRGSRRGWLARPAMASWSM
jgi:hypothetical protein